MLNLNILVHKQATFGSKSLRIFGPQVWSSLSYHIKSSENFDSFKMINTGTVQPALVKFVMQLKIQKDRLSLKGEYGTGDTSRMHHVGMVVNYHKVLRPGCCSCHRFRVWLLYSSFVQILILCLFYGTHLQLGFLYLDNGYKNLIFMFSL